jgi:hypothetical protein
MRPHATCLTIMPPGVAIPSALPIPSTSLEYIIGIFALCEQQGLPGYCS